MKILCVIDSLGSGGAQRQLVELAKGFKEKGHQVSFLIYHNVVFYPDLADEGIPIYCIAENNYLKRLLKMRKYIRNGNFSAVLSFLEAANFICTVSSFPLRNWKLIVGERSANPKILKSWKLIFYRWFHLFADYVVANSKENLKMVRKINPLLTDGKCKVIYNLINPSCFNKTSVVSKTNNVLNVVVGASHQYLKNAKGMLDALSKLPLEERERLNISWYGDRTTEPFYDNSFIESNKLVRENNLNEIVKFFPATTSIIDIMAEADVVGLFSFYEGLPNAICEGLALGKPVMVSNVSDIPTLLKHTPDQIFDPNDVNNIKAVFQYYLSLDRNQLKSIGNLNKKVAEDFFNKENIIKEYLDLMK